MVAATRIGCVAVTAAGMIAVVGFAAVTAVADPMFSPGPVPVTAPQAGAPKAIPALRQWSGAPGSFTFTATSRVVVDQPAVAALHGTATTLAADLTVLTGAPVAVADGQPAAPGDVLLGLGQIPNSAPSAQTAAEAYRLSIGPVVGIEGATDTAVFNGTRTLLQLLHQSRSIGHGTAIDWPAYAERGLLVDVGRKFLPVDWLRDRIRDLAYLKMNLLHLHLSDNPGFRLQSDTHPEITSPEHYSKQQMTDLIDYATRYHVLVVPEIDFPAHDGAILAPHPDLQLVSDTGKVSADLIDLSKPAAYALIQDLLVEFLPLFPGKYWHIGADEYLTDYRPYPQLLAYARAHYGPTATARDTYYGYFNWADAIVRAAGKTTRAWNDGLHPGDGTIAVDPDVVIDYWSVDGPLNNPWLLGSAYSAPQLVSAGHLVANDAYSPTYYTTGLQGQLLTAATCAMYDLWNPTIFVGGARISDPTKNLGSMLSLWFDDPDVSVASATAGIHDRLRVMAQQTWGSPKPAPLYYLGFSALIGTIGDPPG